MVVTIFLIDGSQTSGKLQLRVALEQQASSVVNEEYNSEQITSSHAGML